MKVTKGEAGFTLVELLVASAVAALVLSLLSAATYQFFTATSRGHDRLGVLRDHGTAFQWINHDGQMAVSALATVGPASVTLHWTDAVSGASYQSGYAQSGDELVRTLTVDGATTTQTVARNLAASGFSASKSGDLLSITVTSTRGGVTQTRTETVLMRPPVATATPFATLAPSATPTHTPTPTPTFTPTATPTHTPTPTPTFTPTPTPTYTPTPTPDPDWLATGTYTGNGSDNRQITGVGFQPDVVFIKSEKNRDGVARTSTMTGDATKVLNSSGSLSTDRIQSLDADGFTVGTHKTVNKAGETYHWVAMKAGSNLAVGTYVGDGSDDRSITGVGFAPVWLVTLGDGARAMYRPGPLSGDNSYRMTGGNKRTNRIQALEADGFQLGNNNDVNKSGKTFHYIAWASTANTAVGSYTGDGSDNRSITGAGFQPEMVWAKRDDSKDSVWRSASVTGDKTLYWAGKDAKSDRIQALEADGFQTGKNDEVNKNNKTYYYLALDDGT